MIRALRHSWRPGLCALAVGAALLAVPWRAQASDLRHRMEEARFFVDQGRPAEALAALDAVIAEDPGRTDPQAHALRVRAALAVGDGGRAKESCQLLRLWPEDEAAQGAAEDCRWVHDNLAPARIAGWGDVDAVALEAATPILDPRQKLFFKFVAAVLAGPLQGEPLVHLPAGAYRVGPRSYTVTAGESVRIDLRPGAEQVSTGLYGERRRAKGSVGPRVWVGGAGALVVQQGNAAGAGRFVAAVSGVGSAGLGGEIGLALGVMRAERVHGEVGAPPSPDLAIRGGLAWDREGARGPSVAVRAMWSVGVAPIVLSAMPDAYVGPSSYLVHGPDVEARLSARAARGFRPYAALGVQLRESIPLGDGASMDPRPHLSVGPSLSVGVLWSAP